MGLWFGKNKENLEEKKVEEVAPSPEKIVNSSKVAVKSPIPSEARVVTRLDFDEPVQISGSVEGEIFSASTITVAKDGAIVGTVEADSFEIYGKAEGQLKARSKLVLHKGASVSAEIATPKLEIQDGALFNGNCSVVHD